MGLLLYIFNQTVKKFKWGFYNEKDSTFRLPDLSAFDGILLDLATISIPSLKEEIITTARNAGVPVISLLEKIPGLYFSGIDNYDAVSQLMEHLITEHDCRTFNYVGGHSESDENQERFRAYKETLLKHSFSYESERVTGHDYNIRTGLQAFEEFFSLNDYINLADEKMYTEKKERKATRQ